jgi:hypothetical protein
MDDKFIVILSLIAIALGSFGLCVLAIVTLLNL